MLLATTGAQAMPPASAEDDMGRFMAEKRLVDRLEEVRVTMGEGTYVDLMVELIEQR